MKGRQPHGEDATHPPVTAAATAGDANDALAAAAQASGEQANLAGLGDGLLAFHPPEMPPTQGALDLASLRFWSDPLLALEVINAGEPVGPGLGEIPTVADLVVRLQPPLGSPNREPGGGQALVVRVAAVVEVGGFDPTMPGLGIADLVTRIVGAGWHVSGLRPLDIPFVDGLHFGLTVSEQLRSEAKWLQLHHPGDAAASRKALDTFASRTRQAIKTVTGGRGADSSGTLDLIGIEAERRWGGATAHEVQANTGHRADWRFLLPSGRRNHTLILDDSEPDRPRPEPNATRHQGRWGWLIEDGWTERVSTRASSRDPADVALVGPDHAIGPAADALGTEGSICVLRVRQPLAGPGRGAGRREAAELADLGFASIRRYLAVPDLEQAKRFIPLDHPGGLAWLSATSPPAAVGGLSGPHRARRRLARLIGAEVARLTGDVVVVAQRLDRLGSTTFAPAGLDQAQLPLGTNNIILLTSGFDEGSRAVLLPLVADHEQPQAVIKISSRPAYNDNVDREAKLLSDMSQEILRPGLLPESGGAFDVGQLRGSKESYAGRWSGSDVLNEQGSLSRRRQVLDLVADAINDLGEPAVARLTWSPQAFDNHIGHWLDRLDQQLGPSPTIDSLRHRLAERSKHLEGMAIPLTRRHYDLGPWNVVFSDTEPGSISSPVTIVDWELAPPRSTTTPGLACADLLYFIKYWLHIAMGIDSADDELAAFPFLADSDSGSGSGSDSGSGSGLDPRRFGAEALRAGLARAGIDSGFVPLLATHVWAEAACYTIERRRANGGDPGSPYRYLLALARHRHRFLAAWPIRSEPHASGPDTSNPTASGRGAATE